jgi:hypothetical protein
VWLDAWRGELCEIIWGPETDVGSGATINWQPSTDGLDVVINLDTTATTLHVITPTPGIEPGSRGKLRIVQDVGGANDITAITGSAGGFVAHMPNNGTIIPLSAGGDDVDIWDWYTPDGLNFYFSEFGNDYVAL